MTDTDHTTPAPRATTLAFDPEAYREHVSDMGLTTSQEDELLRVLWAVIVGIIDLKCGPHIFADQNPDAKMLAADSSAVLAFLSASKTTNGEDAKTEDRPDAQRMDS